MGFIKLKPNKSTAILFFAAMITVGLFENCSGFSPATFAQLTANGASAKPGPTPPPSGPNVLLQWDAEPSTTAITGYTDTVTGYTLEQSTDGVNFSVEQTLGADATSVTVYGLSQQTYYFRISAFNQAGASGPSQIITAVIP